MHMKKILLIVSLFLPSLGWGQVSNPSIISVGSTPSSCGTLPLYVVANTNQLYGTNGSGGCSAIGGGGSGTVTSVSGLTPLFTVTTPTTTPTFVLSNAAQNSVFAGPGTGGAGAPSYQTAPTFSAANLTSFPTLPYLPSAGGTITGALTEVNPASSGTVTLLTIANTAGTWAGLNIQSNSNSLNFQGDNQFQAYSTFMGVAPSVFVGLGTFGPPIYVFGVGVSCSSGSPNSACVGGFFQAPSTTVLNLAAAINGTSPLTFNVIGHETTSVSMSSPVYLTPTTCTSTASPAVCGVNTAGIVQVAAAATSLVIDSSNFTANTGCWFTYDIGGITAPANISLLIPPYISARTAGTSITITLPVAPGTNPVNIRFGCEN
jgi:hypothetical protein